MTVRKFEPNGQVKHFPGNTILSFIPPGPLETLSELHARLSELKIESLAMLPIESFHITIIEGALDYFRRPGFWPDNIDTLDECSDTYFKTLQNKPILSNPPYTMRIDRVGVIIPRKALTLRMAPSNEEENTRLRTMRDDLSKTINLRQSNHDDYEFHISIAYIVNDLKEGEAERIKDVMDDYFEANKDMLFTLENMSFCLFEDMLEFVPHLKASKPSESSETASWQLAT